MTSQQFPPAGDPPRPFGAPPPMVQQSAVPFAPSPPPAGRRTGLIAAGVLLLAAGVAAGVVMLMASGTNYDESVENLARAPVGCTTALEFDEAGTFTVYVETRGRIGEIRGDCPATDTDYRFAGDVLPAVDIVITDEDGGEVDLDDDFDKDYDAGGSVGQSIHSVVIDEAGDYDITVTSDEADFAIAIGKDPKDDADSLRTNAIIAGAAGVVLGGALLLLGLRRRSVPPPSVPPYASASPPYAPGPPTTTVAATGWAPAAPAPPPPPTRPPGPPPPPPPPGPSSWPAPPST
jgi:hypothetical protein